MNPVDQNHPVESVKAKAPWKRGELWLVFVVLFVGTPIFSLMVLNETRGQMDPFFWTILGGGTLGAGFTLSKLFTRREATFATLGVVFSVLIFVIYVATAAALIMNALNHMGC